MFGKIEIGKEFLKMVVSRTPLVIHCLGLVAGAEAKQSPRPPLSLGAADKMRAARRSFLKSGAITVLMAGIAIDLAPSVFAQSNQNDPTKDFPIPFEAQQS